MALDVERKGAGWNLFQSLTDKSAAEGWPKVVIGDFLCQ
jgi:hypothetical protein